MRKVPLPKDSVRGGVMTQASVLKVTANGTTTSPVVRGAWAIENLLGIHIPPPPNVPAVEPDLTGATTLRQPSCRACRVLFGTTASNASLKLRILPSTHCAKAT